MYLLAFCCAVALAVLFPETREGKALRRVLIESPAKRLNRLSWSLFGFWLLVIVAVVAVIAVMGMEGVQITALTVPEFIAWFVTFDIATYIDAIAIVWMLAALARARTLIDLTKTAAAKSKKPLAVRARARRIRAARSRRTRAERSGRQTAKTKSDGRRTRRPLVQRPPIRGGSARRRSAGTEHRTARAG